jgi:DNA-binding transcriptional MerR regulator
VSSRVELPDKLYFKIGEVARIVGVKQHVLRYWETEFSVIRPQKSKSNQRLYRRQDVETILAIKHLLYDQKFTIEGARKHLKEEGVEAALPPPEIDEVAARARENALSEAREELGKTRAELRAARERQLLSLRQQAEEFLAILDDRHGAES